MSSQTTAKCQSDHHSPVPCLSLFPLHISSKGLCSLLLAAEGMHQPSMAEPEGQPNSSHGAHSLLYTPHSQRRIIPAEGL